MWRFALKTSSPSVHQRSSECEPQGRDCHGKQCYDCICLPLCDKGVAKTNLLTFLASLTKDQQYSVFFKFTSVISTLVNLQSSSSTMAFRGTLVGHQWGAQVHLQQLACGPKQIRCNTSAKGNFLMKVSTSIKILGSTTSSPGLTPSHGHGFSSLWN